MGSWIPSYWYDEAASVSGSSRPLASLWRMMHNIDAVHGLYYAGLHFWSKLFGTSEFAVRFPSAIAVGLATAGLWVLAKRIGSPRFANLAAVVFILLPRTTWMGAEGRSMAIVTALVLWSTVLVIRLVCGDLRRRWWLAYAILLGTATAAHLFAALIAPVHLVAVVAFTGSSYLSVG